MLVGIKRLDKWHAYIMFKGKLYNLGYYATLEEAKKAREEAENRMYGEFLEWYKNEYNK